MGFFSDVGSSISSSFDGVKSLINGLAGTSTHEAVKKDVRLFWAYGGNKCSESDINNGGIWPAVHEILNFSNMKISFQCGAGKTLCDDCSDSDSNSKFYVNLTADSLLSQFISQGQMESLGGVNTIGIPTQISNLVNKPWLWMPPGGLYAIGGGPSTCIRDVISNIISFSRPNTNGLSVQGKKASWLYFEEVMPLKGDFETYTSPDFSIAKWEDADGSITPDTNGMRFENGPAGDFTNATLPIRYKDVYRVFSKLSANSTLTGFLSAYVGDDVYPTSVALVLQASIHSAGYNTEVTSHFLDEFNKTYVGSLQGGMAVLWVNNADKKSGSADGLNKVLLDLSTGSFVIPIDLKKCLLAGAQSVGSTSMTLQVGLGMYVMRDAYLVGIGEASKLNSKGGIRYTFNLNNPSTSSFNQSTTIDMIDWSTTIGTISSGCTDCSPVACTNGVPVIKDSGTCGTRINAEFKIIEDNAQKLLKNFKSSITTAANSQQGVINGITNLISTFKSTEGYIRLQATDAKKVDVINKLSSNLGSILTKIQKTNQEVAGILEPNGKSWEYDNVRQNICTQSATIGEASAIYNELKSSYDSIKDIFTDVDQLINATPVKDTDKFDIEAALNSVKNGLTTLFHAQNAASDSSAAVSKGETANPGEDDGFTPTTTGGDGDGGGGSSGNNQTPAKTGGLSDSVKYILAAVGALLVVGVVVYFIRRRRAAAA
jgi:hypothetical protein